MEDVLANPGVGELKKGDLAGFRVHKFTMNHQLTLMAYKAENDFLILYQVGPHENFYKNLKRYLKEMEDKKELVKVLKGRSDGGEVITLLCWEKDDKFCHRRLLKDLIENS